MSDTLNPIDGTIPNDPPPGVGGGPPPWAGEGSGPPKLPLDMYTAAGHSKYILEVSELNPDTGYVRLVQYDDKTGERADDARQTVRKSELEEQKAYLLAELARVNELIDAFVAVTPAA